MAIADLGGLILQYQHSDAAAIAVVAAAVAAPMTLHRRQRE